MLSGGQILKMKRSISGNKTDEDGGGEDIFHFSEPHTVQSVKKSLRSAAEEMGNHLDKDTQELVINEGIRVFELNNTLINRFGHRRSFIRNKPESQAVLGIRKTLLDPESSTQKGMVISRYSSFLKFCMQLNLEFLRQNSKFKCMQIFLNINCTLMLAAPFQCI